MTSSPTATPPGDPEQQARELRKLLRAEELLWPVATPRSQPKLITVSTALDYLRDVIDQLDGYGEETRESLRRWREEQGELTGALGYLVPGIAKMLEQRQTLIGQLLDYLTRLQANYDGDRARDDTLINIATLDALAAGKVPEEGEDD
jgi:hypothetical protein